MINWQKRMEIKPRQRINIYEFISKYENMARDFCLIYSDSFSDKPFHGKMEINVTEGISTIIRISGQTIKIE